MSSVILIPYRDRKEHLDYFIKNCIPLLKQHLDTNIKIIVIEQEEGKLFNRGKLLNIGYKEFGINFNYIITHDVDLIPDSNTVQSLYTIQKDVVRIFCGHERSCGGICKISSKVFKEVNGFPSDIWGWGVEDRALYYRFKIYGKDVSPLYNKQCKLKWLHHQSNGNNKTERIKKQSRMENIVYQRYTPKEQKEYIMKSGLNTLNYKIHSQQKINDNVEWIKVSI